MLAQHGECCLAVIQALRKAERNGAVWFWVYKRRDLHFIGIIAERGWQRQRNSTADRISALIQFRRRIGRVLAATQLVAR